MEQEKEKSMATFCHAGALLGLVVPFANIIVPLIIWLTNKEESALVDAEGKKSLNFQISLSIYGIVSFLLLFVVIGIVLLPVVGVFGIVMVILAAIKTNKGEDFKYPLSITFIK